ncbi:hypothetical protein FV219_00735 [Methylobacterium sp. WL122]|nr:hypothetical protein FV219_00735 [Methylobacterium sp. WL122]
MTWFDLVHYSLVGFGVLFVLLLFMLAWQKIVELIVLLHSKKTAGTVHHLHSEEHHVHHVQRVVEYDDDFNEIQEKYSFRPKASNLPNAPKITNSVPTTKIIAKSPVR